MVEFDVGQPGINRLYFRCEGEIIYVRRNCIAEYPIDRPKLTIPHKSKLVLTRLRSDFYMLHETRVLGDISLQSPFSNAQICTLRLSDGQRLYLKSLGCVIAFSGSLGLGRVYLPWRLFLGERKMKLSFFQGPGRICISGIGGISVLQLQINERKEFPRCNVIGWEDNVGIGLTPKPLNERIFTPDDIFAYNCKGPGFLILQTPGISNADKRKSSPFISALWELIKMPFGA